MNEIVQYITAMISSSPRESANRAIQNIGLRFPRSVIMIMWHVTISAVALAILFLGDGCLAKMIVVVKNGLISTGY